MKSLTICFCDATSLCCGQTGRRPFPIGDIIMKRKTDTVLPKDEAAIITNKGKLELLVPDLDDDAPVPELLSFLVACFIRSTHDENFYRGMVEWAENEMEKNR